MIPSHIDTAFYLRITPTKALENLLALKQAHLLDETTEKQFTPHNWKGRQYESDNSADRVSRYRDRMKQNGSQVGGYLKHKTALFQRDGAACVYCGSIKNLCIDHMIPVILGGDDDPTNLCVACKFCNSGKAGRTPRQAGFVIRVAATREAYKIAEARLLSPDVTVTVTAPEQIQNRSRTDTEQTTEAMAAEFPQSFAFLRAKFPASTDEALVRVLVDKSVRAVLEAGEDPKLITDKVLLIALQECTRKEQHSAALYLSTVPNWMKNKASA